MRFTLSGMTFCTDAPAGVRAVTTTLYEPSASSAPSSSTVCWPPPVHTRSSSVVATPPIESVTCTVTFADAEIRYVSVVASAWPSAFGLIASGSAARASIASGAAPPPARNVPTAGRALPAETVQPYEPAGNPAESHVQSTAVPVPVPRATSVRTGALDRDGPGLRLGQTCADSDRGARNARPRIEDLRSTDAARSRCDRAEPPVEDVAGAGGESRISVPRDPVQQHGDAARVAVTAAGDEREKRGRVDVGEVEPPGDDLGDRLLRRDGRSDVLVGAEKSDADRAGVEAHRVRADDVAVDASETTLVDRPEPVDEKVVADVVPAVSPDVEELDPLHDRGGLAPRVAVLPGRVMHDGEADVGGVARRAAPDLLVGSPRRAWDDRRRDGCRRRSQRDARLRAPDEMRPEPRHVSRSRGPGCDPTRRPTTGSRDASPSCAAPWSARPARPRLRAQRHATHSSGPPGSAFGTARSRSRATGRRQA